MPNWCQNSLEISHADPKMIEMFESAFNMRITLETFLPPPEGDDEFQYNWRVENWGTKWDIGSDGSFGEISEDKMTFICSFDSAWSPPIEAYAGLLKLGFTVDAKYYEPGMGFYGYYSGDPEDGGSETTVEYNDYLEIPDDIIDQFLIEEWEFSEESEG